MRTKFWVTEIIKNHMRLIFHLYAGMSPMRQSSWILSCGNYCRRNDVIIHANFMRIVSGVLEFWYPKRQYKHYYHDNFSSFVLCNNSRHRSTYLASLAKYARRAMCFACVNFFLFLFFKIYFWWFLGAKLSMDLQDQSSQYFLLNDRYFFTHYWFGPQISTKNTSCSVPAYRRR